MNIFRGFFGKVLFVLIAVVVGGSLILLGGNKSKQASNKQAGTVPPITSVPTSKPLAPASAASNPITTNKTQGASTPAPTIDLKEALKNIFKNRVFPTSVPAITFPPAAPTKVPVFGCSAEGQAEIDAYNQQIRQEYDVCAADANAKVQQVFTICGQDQNCIMDISKGPNNCTLSYQEKQKYVLTLMSQYCGMR